MMRKTLKIFLTLVLVALATGCTSETFRRVFLGREIKGARVISLTTKCDIPSCGPGELICETPIELGDTTAYLSVYVSDMEDCCQTKAIETTTDNIISSCLAMRVYDENGDIYVSSDNDPEKPDTAKMANVKLAYSTDEGGVWNLDGTYYWPIDGKPLTFCSFAPDTVFNSANPAITDFKLVDGKMQFKYVQPYGKHLDKDGIIDDDALAENDLLVAMGTQDAGSDGRVKIHFKHALVGVRFMCGELHGVKLDHIALEGLYDSGIMTFNPADGNISWDCQGCPTRTFRQSFANESGEMVVEKEKLLDPDSDKRRTFMMIPQLLNEDSATITLEIAGNIHSAKLKISDLNEGNVGGTDKAENIRRIKDWRAYAGKVITFRVSLASNVNMVNISVTDEVDGLTKKNIVIKNEGTTPVFIRETLVGNWTNSDDEIIASWDERNPYGTFYSNAAGKAVNFNDYSTLPDRWTYKATGLDEDKAIFYYRRYLAPGQTLKQNLFDTFTVTSKPVSANGSWEGNIKMEIAKMNLCILVQAVSAVNVNSDGSWSNQNYTFNHVKEAWGEDAPIISGDPADLADN